MHNHPSVIAVVTAGWSPSDDDPLAEYTGNKPKALIPIAGKPMIVYAVDALARSRYVDHVVVVALTPSDEVTFSVPVDHVPDAGGIIANAEAGLQFARTHYPDFDAVLLSSSDLPTITPSIVDAFIEECSHSDRDLYYCIVERSVMEGRFPNSRRSYIRLRDGDFAGGDLVFIRPGLVISNRQLLQNLSNARKSVFQQVRMLGLWTLFKLITHRLSLADAERRASKVLGVRGKCVPFPYAEAGMDVDKPFQLEIVRSELEA